MYNESPTKANGLASTLRRGFEEALTERLQQLSSHREVVEYAVKTGHRTRPVGCLLACLAVGGEWRGALDAAVAVELIHKSSVIRDDIVDGDEVRSGQPALHVVCGLSTAIAVSDLLWALGLRQISARSGGQDAEDRLLRACTDALLEMSSGQLEDVSPSLDSRSQDARLSVEERKTGALSELACRLGGLSGEGTSAEVAALAQYGRRLGTAFQVLNDVRNLRGDESERSPASDVRKRRDTVLSAHVREHDSSPTRDFFDDLRRGTGDLTDAEVQAAREMLLSAGAADFGEDLASRLMTDARGDLQALAPTPARVILESLTRDVLLAYAF